MFFLQTFLISMNYQEKISQKVHHEMDQSSSTSRETTTSQATTPQTTASQAINSQPTASQAKPSQAKRPKPDISSGWTKTGILGSYLAGALKDTIYKPRGKPSDVWQRGMHAVCKADNTLIENWYICKRMNQKQEVCNELFNLQLSADCVTI